LAFDLLFLRDLPFITLWLTGNGFTKESRSMTSEMTSDFCSAFGFSPSCFYDGSKADYKGGSPTQAGA
jgi:hypothetical protein